MTANQLMQNLEKLHNRRKAVIWVSNGYDFNPFAESRLGEDPVFGGRFGMTREEGQQAQQGNPGARNQFADADLARELAEAVAAGIGVGLYRGSRRVNLRTFFRATGILLVFVAAPSREEQRRRLEGRGTESPESVARRLEEAEVEEQIAARSFDAVVVNDDVDRAVTEIAAILAHRRGGEDPR